MDEIIILIIVISLIVSKFINLMLLTILLYLIPTLTLSFSQYRVTSTQTTSSTMTLTLAYTGSEQYYLKKSSPIIKHLAFTLHTYTFSDFAIKITDPNKERFEVPQEGIFPIDPLRNFSYPISLAAFRIQVVEEPFDFRIVRKINNATLFSSFGGMMVFSQYYLEIDTEVDSDYNYGLGQRFNPGFRLRDGKWTMFTRDRGQLIDQGQGKQTYGYYPFYLQMQRQRFFHINYIRSSNAMDVIKQKQQDKHILKFKIIGGIFDFRFFLGQQSPQLTIQKFHTYIGKSAIPPFWSLGFHQSRWGYEDVDDLQQVLNQYEKNGLPLDTIWSDIDYMDDLEDFTIDQESFPLDRMKKITEKYHYVPIIDAGIKVGDGIPYLEGKKRNVFIKDAVGNEFRGKVWPGTTTFVDFFHPNSTQYWKDMLDILYKKVSFSGIWLDMNEYSNFCNGPCQQPSHSGFDYSKDLPYNPGYDGIQSATISLNCTHYGNKKQADVHVFSAFLQTYATNQFLKQKGRRPFIITRSSTLGSHKYGFHWTGDNTAEFQFLKSSIADNFLNQLWGFQMVGPDICGFGGDTTEELCARWFQLGSLYPFARNHNAYGSVDQQPYALGQNVLASAKINLKLRYSLLKHYYSLFVQKKGRGTIFNPLMIVFPFDSINYVDQVCDTQFLIGNNLMAAPILDQGVTSRNVYFSTTAWYNLYTGKQYKPGTYRLQNIKITDRVPLFISQNSLILYQDSDSARSTKDLSNRFSLISGMQYDSRISNLTHKYYSAFGTHISLDNYNNDTKIDLCQQQSCQYRFGLLLKVTSNNKELDLNITYFGGAGLNGLMIVDGLVLYFDEQIVMMKLDSAIQIRGTMKTVIPIKDGGDLNHFWENKQNSQEQSEIAQIQ